MYPQPLKSVYNFCWAVSECLGLSPHSGTNTYAPTAFSSLRALAAKKPNIHDGLEAAVLCIAAIPAPPALSSFNTVIHGPSRTFVLGCNAAARRAQSCHLLFVQQSCGPEVCNAGRSEPSQLFCSSPLLNIPFRSWNILGSHDLSVRHGRMKRVGRQFVML